MKDIRYTKAYNYLKMSVTYKILTPNYYLRIIIELIKNMSIYSKCTLLTNDHSNSKIK